MQSIKESESDKICMLFNVIPLETEMLYEAENIYDRLDGKSEMKRKGMAEKFYNNDSLQSLPLSNPTCLFVLFFPDLFNVSTTVVQAT